MDETILGFVEETNALFSGIYVTVMSYCCVIPARARQHRFRKVSICLRYRARKIMKTQIRCQLCISNYPDVKYTFVGIAWQQKSSSLCSEI